MRKMFIAHVKYLSCTIMASLLSTCAFASVSSAVPGSNLFVYGGAAPLTAISRSNNFGTDTVFFNSNSVTRTIGQSADKGLPIVSLSAHEDNTGDGLAGGDASLTYFWKITSIGSMAATPVLIHVNTAGWIESTYGFDPFQKNRYNFPTWNPTEAGAEADFTLHMSNGAIETRSIGVNMAAPMSRGVGV
jgi:hypothetical protein